MFLNFSIIDGKWGAIACDRRIIFISKEIKGETIKQYDRFLSKR